MRVGEIGTASGWRCVSVARIRFALVRFCPLKSQPVRSLPPVRCPASSSLGNWRWRRAGLGEATRRGVREIAPVTTAPVRLASVSVEEDRFALVRLAPVRLASLSVEESSSRR